MNLGLGNLIGLKKQLLNDEVRLKTEFDTKIAVIGRSVAASFDRYCNRTFAWSATARDEFSADRGLWILRRYPVPDIQSVFVQDDPRYGFVDQGDVNSSIQKWEMASGLVQFGYTQGTDQSVVRINYEGGYWFDDTEDASGTQPEDATLLPDDIQGAWYLQCQAVWEKNDPLASKFIGGEKNSLVGLSLGGLDLVPLVKATLDHHRRFRFC